MSKWLAALGAMHVWYNHEITDLTRIVKIDNRPKFQPLRIVFMSDAENANPDGQMFRRVNSVKEMEEKYHEERRETHRLQEERDRQLDDVLRQEMEERPEPSQPENPDSNPDAEAPRQENAPPAGGTSANTGNSWIPEPLRAFGTFLSKNFGLASCVRTRTVSSNQDTRDPPPPANQ